MYEGMYILPPMRKKNCPEGAIDCSSGVAVINPLLCKGCGICQEKCPTKAIVMHEKIILYW